MQTMAQPSNRTNERKLIDFTKRQSSSDDHTMRNFVCIDKTVMRESRRPQKRDSIVSAVLNMADEDNLETPSTDPKSPIDIPKFLSLGASEEKIMLALSLAASPSTQMKPGDETVDFMFKVSPLRQRKLSRTESIRSLDSLPEVIRKSSLNSSANEISQRRLMQRSPSANRPRSASSQRSVFARLDQSSSHDRSSSSLRSRNSSESSSTVRRSRQQRPTLQQSSEHGSRGSVTPTRRLLSHDSFRRSKSISCISPREVSLSVKQALQDELVDDSIHNS